jgi:hypothetical protein
VKAIFNSGSFSCTRSRTTPHPKTEQTWSVVNAAVLCPEFDAQIDGMEMAASRCFTLGSKPCALHSLIEDEGEEKNEKGGGGRKEEEEKEQIVRSERCTQTLYPKRDLPLYACSQFLNN